jgi:hypothetical protein
MAKINYPSMKPKKAAPQRKPTVAEVKAEYQRLKNARKLTGQMSYPSMAGMVEKRLLAEAAENVFKRYDIQRMARGGMKIREPEL